MLLLKILFLLALATALGVLHKECDQLIVDASELKSKNSKNLSITVEEVSEHNRRVRELLCYAVGVGVAICLVFTW